LAAAELAAEILHRKLKTVAQLLPEYGRRPRQRGDDADLHLVLRLSARRGEPEGRNAHEDRNRFLHRPLPFCRANGQAIAASPAPADPVFPYVTCKSAA